jgi:hypothetical protein
MADVMKVEFALTNVALDVGQVRAGVDEVMKSKAFAECIDHLAAQHKELPEARAIKKITLTITGTVSDTGGKPSGGGSASISFTF